MEKMFNILKASVALVIVFALLAFGLVAFFGLLFAAVVISVIISFNRSRSRFNSPDNMDASSSTHPNAGCTSPSNHITTIEGVAEDVTTTRSSAH